MKHIKIIIFGLSSLVVTVIAYLYYQQLPLFESIEVTTYDWRYSASRGALEPDPRIGIITIDDRSIAEIGRFPWSRHVYADLLRATNEAGVKAVLFDAFFPEQQDTENDGLFSGSISDAGNVTLALAFDFSGEEIGITRSIPTLREAARREAHINVLPDEDGVIRWTPLVVPFDPEERLYPSLGLAGAMELLNVKQPEPVDLGIALGGLTVPTDGDGFHLINYVGPSHTYPRYSFTDIVHGRIDPAELKDKVLFLGATALGVYDMRVTPFSGNMPGVEMHANIADSIANERFMYRGGFETLVDLLAIMLLGLAAITITLFVRNLISLPLTILTLFTYVGFVCWMFAQGHWLSILYPVLSLVLSFAITANLKFIFLDRKSKEIRSIFSSYLPANLVKKLIETPEFAKLGGDNRQVTLMFVDIANYTAFSERHTPEEVVKTLNEYLSYMTRIIIESGGTLDKFLGDGIMAFWGAPLPQPDHAERAVRSAVLMAKKMDDLARTWAARGETPLSFRIGINSGDVIVGNIGVPGMKMEYTAIGDSVNLAARLESLNKYYGTRILVNESTRNLASTATYRKVDLVKVKGKSHAASIFELVLNPQPWHEAYQHALNRYHERNFETALAEFEELEKQYQDPLARLYAERCRQFQTTPPPENWDGVFLALSK